MTLITTIALSFLAAPSPQTSKSPTPKEPRLYELEVKNIDVHLQTAAKEILKDLETQTLSEATNDGMSVKESENDTTP